MIVTFTSRFYAPIRHWYAPRAFQHVPVCPPAPVDNRPAGGNVFRQYILPKGMIAGTVIAPCVAGATTNCLSREFTK